MKYSRIKRNDDGRLEIGPIDGVPDITRRGITAPAALFLGPRAENRELLDELIGAALRHIYEYRSQYLPGDPQAITPTERTSASYQSGVQELRSAYRELLDFLTDHATPYFSLRYQGHMLWDNTLPAIAGYFAAMLHNPNNVSIQASTSTTPLAILVGWDLCTMVGYVSGPEIEPWSHLTADGSLANIEATWATREARYLPVALRAALRCNGPREGSLAAAHDIDLPLCDGSRVALADADDWQLMNIKLDDALALPQRVARICGIDDEYEVWNVLKRHGVNAVGWSALVGGAWHRPAILTAATKHYSWPKAAAVTGFGTQGLVNIDVDADARLDITSLDEALADCLERRIPVAMVVAACGSTEESAVDPIAKILDLRERYRARGLDFNIHVDAAWGGYMLAAIRQDFRFPDPDTSAPTVSHTQAQQTKLFIDNAGTVAASDYVVRQLKHIRLCDSATIDPHKWGYVPYPAGSVLYRNGEMRRLTSFSGAYIGDSRAVEMTEPCVGVFGLEGSRPGAAAAAVFLSHRCIRPSVSGYGTIINECLFNTRRFYARLLDLNAAGSNFIVVPLPRLPAEKHGGDVGQQLQFIRHRILGKTNDALLRDQEAMALFRELGPDQNILDYAFNFRHRDGSLNMDVDRFNRFNGMIYDAFHIGLERHVPIANCRFIVSNTAFSRNEYGAAFMDTFAARIGLVGAPERLACLRSVVMDPYLTHTADGSYFVEIVRIIRETVSRIVDEQFQLTAG